ncbi:type II secretion system protein [Humisphaera borealis]|uniref:Prepilin-type N-terminal cleavage/methylation domain-containing protein n=1 Tax=Humisphaera borealis TaxID=2807512 RepID=A0A7M2X2T9_9BACT|nr:prepilin-type N-terminal cleavage/methylation domain-containing protein [Humisphaera borealis]QOV91994.1 prepilin-type N-terminal cleavage/methylation domain-containing protein [Humisphaera borealis]
MIDRRQRLSSSRPAGFTLIELLVVIGIITLLLSILLPVVGRVQVQAQSAKTQSTIAAIAGAMERYFLDEKSYPGLYSNAQIAAGVAVTFTSAPPGAGTRLTMSEAGAAALAGGLEPVAANLTGPATCELNSTGAKYTIGKGPMSFSPSVVSRTRRTPYIDIAPGANMPLLPFSLTGCAATNLDQAGIPPAAPTRDSGFPEFHDAYSQARPIIYLRANAGAAGIASPMATQNPAAAALKQYTTYEFNYYKRGANAGFPGDFNFVASDPDIFASLDDYMRHPNVSTEPRGKDKFILVSAGPDRVFGTRDDIFFGGAR